MTDPEIHGYAWMWYGDEWRIEQDPNYRDLPLMPSERTTPAPTRTLEDRAQVFIAEGLCPCCKVDAPEGVCPICGWERAKDRSVVEPERGSVINPAQAELPVDEYSPAQVEAA